MSMLAFLAAAGFAAVLLPPIRGSACPPSCSCEPLRGWKGLHVDCSSRGLRALPALPRNTRSLDLRNNSLSRVPAGLLDSLPGLQSVDMAGNPWHCDCHLLHMKLWLQDLPAPSLHSVRCASPAPLSMRALAELTGNELGMCKRLLPVRCLEFFWRDLILLAGAIITLLLAAWALKFSKKLVCQLNLSRYCLLRRHTPKNHKAH
ncbi:platelet glycoprotein IX [Myiozetetes cayanensis]|uniref:platelet glycoprotein IX n=1 Tax=Myiozetetes cayanensis TaxID=478635 RepID=UPI00215F2D2A|nr:platelet glycoprotein IX [Myiozetetes cayanensis]